jgi:Mn2+/Fe2+ NRAMP family transporter
MLMVLSSVINGLLLPFVLLFALSLVNNKKIMGEHTNPKGYNVIAWATIVSIVVLATVMVITTIAPIG